MATKTKTTTGKGLTRKVGGRKTKGDNAVKQMMADFRCVALSYDIPSANQVENPSGLLRRFSYRFNLSCWIMPEGRIPYDLLAAWDTADINYRTYKLDKGETDKVKEDAKKAIDAETRRIHASLIESIGDAQAIYDAAIAEVQDLQTGDATQARLMKAREDKVRAALKRAGEGLNAAVECAQVFDQTENVKDAIEGLRLAIASQQDAYQGRYEAMIALYPDTKQGTRVGGPVKRHDKIMGYSICSICAWFGKNEFTFYQANKVLGHYGEVPGASTVKTAMSDGKGGRKDPAPLTDEQAEELRGIRDAE